MYISFALSLIANAKHKKKAQWNIGLILCHQWNKLIRATDQSISRYAVSSVMTALETHLLYTCTSIIITTCRAYTSSTKLIFSLINFVHFLYPWDPSGFVFLTFHTRYINKRFPRAYFKTYIQAQLLFPDISVYLLKKKLLFNRTFRNSLDKYFIHGINLKTLSTL